jgi:hypothetical protein
MPALSKRLKTGGKAAPELVRRVAGIIGSLVTKTQR